MPAHQVQLDIWNACNQQAFFFDCNLAPDTAPTGIIKRSTSTLEPVQISNCPRPFRQHGLNIKQYLAAKQYTKTLHAPETNRHAEKNGQPVKSLASDTKFFRVVNNTSPKVRIQTKELFLRPTSYRASVQSTRPIPRPSQRGSKASRQPARLSRHRAIRPRCASRSNDVFHVLETPSVMPPCDLCKGPSARRIAARLLRKGENSGRKRNRQENPTAGKKVKGGLESRPDAGKSTQEKRS